ncbi:MAG: glycosyltransferase family 2 protein [Candidatus Gottesmanbacteria bacterium]|nr:glycosyltransferase family 2 protein [Candidatus Gottesmanbacteria bacterium]
MKQTISVVVSAYNEEATLNRCLSSVSFADEIIIVDNSSLDKTAQIAGKFTKNVFKQPNLLMLNINKNYGFSKAKSDWILNLDADEEVPADLAREIQSAVAGNPKENGFWIKRKNIIFGKWINHGLWWPDKQIRLFRRVKGKFACVHIHEYIAVEGQVGQLSAPYLHYNYETVHQYLTKIDRASTSEALSLGDMHYQLAWYDAIRFPLSDFLKIYFAQSGYKDGLHGLVLALFQAFYSFTVFAKFWEMQKFSQRDLAPVAVTRELERAGKETKYWMLTTQIAETNNIFNKILWKIKRKFL